MVAIGYCGGCKPAALNLPGLPEVDPPTPMHCKGSADRPAPKGVLGGWACGCPCRHDPVTLHRMASNRHHLEPEKIPQAYLALMIEAGHVIEREPGDDSPLFAHGAVPSETDGG